jgi:hypothetical protein
MDTEKGHVAPFAAPAGKALFSWSRLMVWLPACVIAGLLAGALTALAMEQTRFAPLVFFPLLVGVFLGLLLVSLMRFAQVAHRATIIAGTLLAVLAAVGMQHYRAYWHAASLSQKNGEQIAIAQQAFPDKAGRMAGALADRPTGFLDYMRREAVRGRPLFRDVVAKGGFAWLTWGIDGLLVLAASLAVVMPALGQPYCDRCETWYHTTRTGRLSAAAALRLAEAAGLAATFSAKRIRYRFISCQSGCGPTGFELSWKERHHGITSVQAWLDAGQRDGVSKVLDEILADRPHKRRR